MESILNIYAAHILFSLLDPSLPFTLFADLVIISLQNFTYGQLSVLFLAYSLQNVCHLKPLWDQRWH